MKKLKLVAAAAALSISSAATAMPNLITEWDFINEAGWTNWLPNATVTPGTDMSDAGNGSILAGGALPTDICWGSPSNIQNQQSCLEVDSPITEATGAQGPVQTVAAFGDYTTMFRNGTALTHRNFVITGSSLTNVTLVDGLQLVGSYNAGANTTGAVLAPELQFAINFQETVNAGTAIPNSNEFSCPIGPNVGSGINTNGCADIFSVIGFTGGNVIASGANFIDFAVDFMVAGVGPNVHKRYELITRLSGLQTLGGGAFGFVTEENKVNVLNAQFAVRAIPEPSTIAMFGLSLIGLTLVSRRKKS